MKNKLTFLLTACLLVAAYFAISEEKMKPDADGDGKVGYEEYKASKEKGHERQFKKMDNNSDGFINAAKSQHKRTK